MPIIGLTGGIGAGKSFVARMFKKQGVEVVNADDIARAMVQRGQPAHSAITEHFGQQVLLENGELNRTKLREIIFNQPEQKHWLEQLIHPLVREEILQRFARCHGSYAILESPLLLETTQVELVDEVIVVDVPEALQIARATQRDNNSEAQIRKIIQAQMPRQERLQKAHHVIDNSGGLEQTQRQVEALHRELLRQYTTS